MEHHESAKNLNRVLSLGSLIFYGLAFMVPLAIFTTYGPVITATHGMVALTYIITTFGMAFIALSYVRMVKAYPVAGSVYTYVQKSINPYLGFMAGWVMLIGYIFLPMLSCVICAIFLSTSIPQVPNWIWIVLQIIIVTIVNHFGIKVADVINKFIVWLQIIFLVVLVFMIFKYIMNGNGTGTFLEFKALYNAFEFNKPGMGFSALFSGASILALSFLGFDAISTLSEEAINPEKNIPKAILYACIGSGIGFTAISYLLQLAWPNCWFEMQSIDGGSYEIIFKVAGAVMANTFTIFYTLGSIVSAISSVLSASRVLYSMGRDNILPQKYFGYLHWKYQTPTYSILIIAVISLSSLMVSLTTAASLLNFGALLGFTMVCLSVVAHYFIKGKKRVGLDLVRYLVAPLIGAAISIIIWVSIDNTAKYIGFAWIAVGLIYLSISTNFFRKLPQEMHIE